MTRARHPHHARGFTLIEVSLAMVLSALVLAGCLSVFLALRNVERTFSARFERTNELDIAHTSLSRAMLSLQMKEATGGTVVRAGSTEAELQAQEEETPERPRLILQTDPTVEPDSTGWVPQRLEVVCATPPVPAGLATQAAEWYTAQSKEESLDCSALDGSQGITRGVFELRPSGQRERLMQRLGLLGTNDTVLSEEQLAEAQAQATYQTNTENKPDWTLWWRPILTTEAQDLTNGYGPYPDTYGSDEMIRERLAGAVPLVRHVERCLWEFYKEDEFINVHEGTEMDDLPAYAQFEIFLTNSQFASWMFEIDWVLGDDPLEVATGSGSTDGADNTNGDGNTNGQPGGGGGGGGNGNGNGRPGGGNGRPGNGGQGTQNQFDFSGDS